MITHKQLTLAEVFEDCQHKFDNDKYHFLALLDEAINLDEIVPVSFVSHFHAQTGRPRKHQLYPMLKALLLQRIFSFPTDTLLIVFLKYSQELRDFCGFDVVPDGSKFTRFKQDFFCIANRKTQNEKTLHADLLLAGITQLITVLVADKIHQLQYIRSLKPLIA